MTIHQAKGLEFPAVYVPGLAGQGSSKIFPDGRPGENAVSNSSALPWWLREDDEGIPSWRTARMADIDDAIRRRKLDEEWRLLYVACTRAQERLVCSAAHWYRGAAEPQGPSDFYTFVAGQTDLVTERFRQEPADVDPEVAAKERSRAAAARRYPASMGPPVARQLTLDDLLLDDRVLEVEPAARAAPPGPGRRRRPCRSPAWSPTPGAPSSSTGPSYGPLPRSSSAAARLGTEVHRWIEQRADRQLVLLEPEADPDLDPDVLPSGAGVAARLKASFLASPYAELDPGEGRGALRPGRATSGHPGQRPDRRRLRAGRPAGARRLQDRQAARPTGQPGAAMQLDLYGLAAIGTWDADPDRLRTTYCWLRTDGPPVVDSRDWDAGTAADVRKRVSVALDALAAGAFGATPGRWCSSCDFQSFCPEGKAADPRLRE